MCNARYEIRPVGLSAILAIMTDILKKESPPHYVFYILKVSDVSQCGGDPFFKISVLIVKIAVRLFCVPCAAHRRWCGPIMTDYIHNMVYKHVQFFTLNTGVSFLSFLFVSFSISDTLFALFSENE